MGSTALALICAAEAPAHDSNHSFLRLRVDESRIEGEWEIHVRDARIALGLRDDAAGDLAWAELRDRSRELHDLLGSALSLASGDGACDVELTEGFRERPAGRDNVQVSFSATCPGPIEELSLGSTLLFDLDPEHRSYFSVEDPRLTHVGVFRDELRTVTIDVEQLDLWREFLTYAREGCWHIWTGADHVFFLIALLLPAPLLRRAGRWTPRERLASVAAEVVKIVTAFTLAHSVTLSLAVLAFVRLPSRWVEAAIAASVFAAAWNNLRPFLPGRAWALAFAFGLVHGLGFAGALEQLGLPRTARGIALFSFNVGVEVGQLVIVAAVLPAIHSARGTARYRDRALPLGSLVIAWLAAVWLLERVLGIRLLPF